MNQILIIALTTIISVILAVLGFLIKSLKETLITRLESIKVDIDCITKKLTALKEEVLRDYVRKEEFEDNSTAHKEFWQELNLFRERIVRIETRHEKPA